MHSRCRVVSDTNAVRLSSDHGIGFYCMRIFIVSFLGMQILTGFCMCSFYGLFICKLCFNWLAGRNAALEFDDCLRINIYWFVEASISIMCGVLSAISLVTMRLL
jgi:hypothetical protein